MFSNHPPPLILAHQTLLHLPPPAFIDLAADAGFDGVTLRVRPVAPDGAAYPLTPGSGLLRETRQRLEARGLFVQDVELLRLQPKMDVESCRAVLESGAAVGARYVAIVSDDCEEERAAENLAAIADEAARFGLGVYLEASVITAIRTIQQADLVVTRANRQNITLMVDVLHLIRAGGTAEDVSQIDPLHLRYAQFSDAPALPPPGGLAGLITEAREGRLFPGEGALPLGDILAALPTDIPLVVEAPNARLLQRIGAAMIASQACAAMRAVLARG